MMSFEMISHYQRLFKNVREGQQGPLQAEPPWFTQWRAQEQNRFLEQGFPTPSQKNWENWRKSNFYSYFQTPWEPVCPRLDQIQVAVFREKLDLLLPCCPFRNGHSVLVFVDGQWSEKLSQRPLSVSDLQITSLREQFQSQPDWVQKYFYTPVFSREVQLETMNHALFSDGCFIHIPSGFKVPHPVHLVFWGRSPALNSNSLFQLIPVKNIIQNSGQLKLIETYLTDEDFARNEPPHPSPQSASVFSQSVTEVYCDSGSTLEHYRILNERAQSSGESVHWGKLRINQKERSFYQGHLLALGASKARVEVEVNFQGAYASTLLNGFTVSRGAQQQECYTWVDHRVPECKSEEFFVGVLQDQSSSVFQGRVIVHPQAQKTVADQSSRNLLLSEAATASTLPQLEILADDVKCSHGATVGQLDREQLYYLRSRGISEAHARQILTLAFTGECLSRYELPELREWAERQLQMRLPSA